MVSMKLFVHLVLFCAFVVSAHAQAEDIDPKYKTADTNDAVIRGRVTLPSGFGAEGYARITLKTAQSILSTLYTNGSGEFQLRNLSEGVYFVEAEMPRSNFESVTRRVELGRGLMVDLVLELREKKDPIVSHTAKVVSAAELRQVVPSAAKKEYQLGLKFVSKGDYQQAATHFQEAIKVYPEYLAARNDLGAQYLKLKRLDEAQGFFESVLRDDPKNFNAKFNTGLVQVERRNYTEALSLLNEAIGIDSTRPVARLWIGIAKLEMGELDTAEAELTRALIMGGEECVAAHYHLARIYMTRGDLPAAARSVHTYLQLAPRGEFITEAKALAQQIDNKK